MTADHTPPITQALGLAAQALFLSSPNPRVGCVITAPDGRVLGEGFTQQVGGPHAEVVALRAASALTRTSPRLGASPAARGAGEVLTLAVPVFAEVADFSERLAIEVEEPQLWSAVKLVREDSSVPPAGAGPRWLLVWLQLRVCGRIARFLTPWTCWCGRAARRLAL